jgi:uncharacterized membrane protein YhaH (DUF805 family)
MISRRDYWMTVLAVTIIVAACLIANVLWG